MLSHLHPHVGRGFADQLEITKRGVVDEAVGEKLHMGQSARIRAGFLGEAKHVIDIKTPFAVRARHAALLS